jgi:putative Holliday junction resolvase
MRILAFDYGTKRIGVAVTDPLQLIAGPLNTVHPEEIWTFIATYISNEAVEAFVIGKPTRMDGSDSLVMPHILGFARKLKKLYPTLEIHWMDERFTSKIATQAIQSAGVSKKKRQDKALVDTLSAVLILQSFLEKRSFSNNI